MTTRSQWVRNVDDSHLNRSIRQRLDQRILWRQQVVMGEIPANHVFVNLDVERQGDLLCDSRTTAVGITLLHFDVHMNEF
jgi:hypothetical protein